MADGIEFLLKIDSKLDGLNAAIAGIKTADAALKKTGESAKHAESLFGSLFKAEFWEKRLEGAIEAVKELGMEAIKSADEHLKLKISFEAMMGAAQTEVEFKWLEELGKQLPGTEEDLKEMERTLLNVGVPMDMMRESLVGINDAAILGGKGIEAVTMATSEIMRRGELSARQLRQFGLSEAEGFEAMSKATGKSTAELKKLSAAGKLKGSDLLTSVLTAVAKKEGGELGGVSLKAGATIFEKFKDIKVAGMNMLRDFVLELTPTITGGLDMLLQALGPDGELGSTIRDTLGNLAGDLKQIDWVGGAKMLITVLGDVLSILGTIITYTMKFVGLLQKAAELVAFVSIGGKTTDQFKYDEEGQAYAAKKKSILDARRRQAMETGSGVLTDHGAEIMRKNIEAGLAGGANPPAMLRRSGADMGNELLQGTKGVLKVQSPSKAFEDIGKNTVLGFQRGLDAGTPTIATPGISGGMEGARGGFQVGQVTVNVEVNATQAGASASEIAETMRIEVPTMILSAFEQLALQGGAA